MTHGPRETRRAVRGGGRVRRCTCEPRPADLSSRALRRRVAPTEEARPLGRTRRRPQDAPRGAAGSGVCTGCGFEVGGVAAQARAAGRGGIPRAVLETFGERCAVPALAFSGLPGRAALADLERGQSARGKRASSPGLRRRWPRSAHVRARRPAFPPPLPRGNSLPTSRRDHAALTNPT